MSFNQGIPGPATLINSSSTLLYGNSASANALSVQQLGAGNVATFRTTTGATALFVGANGNVGVGTTVTGSVLDVYTADTTYGIRHTTGTIAIASYIASGSTTAPAQIGTTTNHKLGFYTNNGGPSVILDTNGRLGIGTASPGYTLQVDTPGTTTAGNAAFFQPGLATGGNFTNLFVGQSSGASRCGVISFGNYGTNTTNVFQLSLNSAGGSTVNITTTGVGIGQTNPQTPLGVYSGVAYNASSVIGSAVSLGTNLGNSLPRPNLSPASANTSIWGYNFASPAADDGFLRLAAGGGTNNASKTFIDMSGYSTIPDMVNTIVMGTGGTERMRITNPGYVGIGTASPGLSLSVNGSVNLGAAYYTGNFNTKTGPFILQASGFDAVGTSHTIAYSSWQGSVNGDNIGGIMIIIGKNLSASGKVGCMTLSVSKRTGAYTYVQTINNNTVGLSTFSVSISSNDIIITSDSDMAITWTFIAGV